MKLLIAATPLFDKDMAVEAYRLYHRDSDKLFGTSRDYTTLDGAMHSQAFEVLNDMGIEPFTGGKPIFVDVNRFMLLTDLESTCKIPFEKVICVLEPGMPAEDLYLAKCVRLKELGFKIALDNVPYVQSKNPLFKLADYIMLDSSNPDRLEELKFMRYNLPRTVVVLKNIDTLAKFEMFKHVTRALYGGGFYNEPITKGANSISPLKANLLNLMRMVADEDFELSEATNVVARDPSLSLSLLRFINSPALGIASKVNSIQNAIALLGQKEMRKWITVAVSTQLSEDKPGEITKLSLTRAKFAENLATSFEMGIHAPSLFLMGLFSLLDVILDQPMSEAVRQIKVSDDVENALVSKKGRFAPVLELIRCYERGDWEGADYIAVINKLKIDDVTQAFLGSMLWYKLLLQEIE